VAAPAAAPDLASLRTLLRPHDADRFDEIASRERGCPADQTVAEYIATLEQNADRHTLTGGCGAFPAHPAFIDPEADAAFWYCRIDGYSIDAGEPWHYELRIRLRKADQAPDFTTVACPGTP
jgi:hypothetical protein